MRTPYRPLMVNRYHAEHQPGQALRLVQFYFEREGDDPLYVSTQEVIALAKRHARYVYTLRLHSVVVIIDEKIIYNDYETGYIATGTHPVTRNLVVGHHQYPSYHRQRDAKWQWHVYQLDLTYRGSYSYALWEDYNWVMTQVDKIRYRRIRERLRALPPV